MPSGYTVRIHDGKPTTFEQFVWSCARGMGALIMMRDDDWNAPIPERFEPGDYAQNKIREIEAQLVELQSLSQEQAEIAAQADYEEAHQKWVNTREERLALRARYEAMKTQVEAWTPPSSDHEGLKTFMISQLDQSIDFDTSFNSEFNKEPVQKDGVTWVADQVSRLGRDLKYYVQSHEEELARTEARNQWLAQLRASVPYTGPIVD